MDHFLRVLVKEEGEVIILKEQKANHYCANVSGFSRNVKVVLIPQSKDQVIAIVKHANARNIKLYPISKGMNWGLGSKLPVLDNCAIVDLSQLNTIIDFDASFGWVTIEPGVTQLQLANYLEKQKCSFILDVTGSGTETSVVGNCLERGTGYNKLRVESVVNLEVLLGNGQIIKTGFAHFEGSTTANLYKYGIGPDLTGCFLQSNFGIVLSLTVSLMPKPDKQAVFSISVTSDKLEAMMLALKQLKTRKVIDCIAHVANKQRILYSVGPAMYDILNNTLHQNISRGHLEKKLEHLFQGDWFAVGNIMGTAAQLRLAKKTVKKTLSPFGKIRFMNKNKITFLKYIAKRLKNHYMLAFTMAYENIYNFNHGIPSDISLRSIYWPNQNEDKFWQAPDHGNSGLIFCTPIIPYTAQDIQELLKLIDITNSAYKYPVAITLNTITDKTLEAVISISFSKLIEAEVNQAHQFLKELIKTFINAGYYPYRIDINNMEQIVCKEDPFWQTVSSLKKCFDPNNIISPCRYNLI